MSNATLKNPLDSAFFAESSAKIAESNLNFAESSAKIAESSIQFAESTPNQGLKNDA